jgi:hypothetical protein
MARIEERWGKAAGSQRFTSTPRETAEDDDEDEDDWVEWLALTGLKPWA